MILIIIYFRKPIHHPFLVQDCVYIVRVITRRTRAYSLNCSNKQLTMVFIHLIYAATFMFNPYYHDFHDTLISNNLNTDSQLYVDVILNHGFKHSLNLLSQLERLYDISVLYQSQYIFSERHLKCHQVTQLLGPCGVGGFVYTDNLPKSCSWNINVETHFSIWLILRNVSLYYSGLRCRNSHLTVVDINDNNTSLILARLCGISRGKYYFSRHNIMQLHLVIMDYLKLGYDFMKPTLNFVYQVVSKSHISNIKIFDKKRTSSYINMQLLTGIHYKARIIVLHINTFFHKVIRVYLEQRYNDDFTVHAFDGLSSYAPRLDGAKNNTGTNYISTLFVISIFIHTEDSFDMTMLRYTARNAEIPTIKNIVDHKPRMLFTNISNPLHNILRNYTLVSNTGTFINLQITQFHNHGFTENACYTNGIIIYIMNEPNKIGPVCGTYSMSSFSPDMKGMTFSSNKIFIFIFAFMETGGLEITMRLSSSRCEGLINQCDVTRVRPTYNIRPGVLVLNKGNTSCVRVQIFHEYAQPNKCNYLMVHRRSYDLINTQMMLSTLPEDYQMLSTQCTINKAIMTLIPTNETKYVFMHREPPLPSQANLLFPKGRETRNVTASVTYIIVDRTCFPVFDSALSVTFTNVHTTCLSRTVFFELMYGVNIANDFGCVEIKVKFPSYGFMILGLEMNVAYKIIFQQYGHQCLDNNAINHIIVYYVYTNFTLLYIWTIEYSTTAWLVANTNIFTNNWNFYIILGAKKSMSLHHIMSGHHIPTMFLDTRKCNTTDIFFMMTLTRLEKLKRHHSHFGYASTYESYHENQWNIK